MGIPAHRLGTAGLEGLVPAVQVTLPRGGTSVGARVEGQVPRQRCGKGRTTLKECLCCSCSCTPNISLPMAPALRRWSCLRIFLLQVLPWGMREGKRVFAIRITPEYSRELRVSRLRHPGWAGMSFWSPASFLQQPCCSEGEN